jgi:D-galactarolactone cycloisomerase
MPKIARIDITSLEYVLASGRGYGHARGINRSRSCSLITLTTDEGIVGVGEAAGPLGVIREYLKLLTPSFVGQSLYDFEITAARLRNTLYHFGAHSHFIAAHGGINIAVVDAMGKTLGLPACDLLGGRRCERLACYATTGYFTDDPKIDIAAQLSAVDLSRFAGAKIKIGAGVASDVARVRAARERLGPDALLMVDYNGNYTVDVALDSLRQIEPYRIAWAEEPLPPFDLRGYAELRRRSPIAIAAGEAHCSVHDFKQLIDARAVDIVQPALTGAGGFAEMKTVALLAQMNNLRLSPSCWGSAIAVNAAIHFAASLPDWPHTDNAPYPLLVEYDVGENPLRDLLAHDPIAPASGGLAVPREPGLGVRLNPEMVARYTLKE